MDEDGTKVLSKPHQQLP